MRSIPISEARQCPSGAGTSPVLRSAIRGRDGHPPDARSGGCQAGRARYRPPIFVLPQDAVHQAQGLTQGPGLEGATTRRVRRIAIRDFGDVPESGLVQVAEQRLEEAPTGFAPGLRGVAADVDPGVHERPDQPRPDGPLVVRAVPFTDAALVVRGI